MADTVNLSWTDHTGQGQHCPADLADISRSGAALRVEHPVKLGTLIAFEYHDQQFAGKVRSCTSKDSAYTLGIEFEDGYRWSPRR
jgi:hypothetical protein